MSGEKTFPKMHTFIPLNPMVLELLQNLQEHDMLQHTNSDRTPPPPAPEALYARRKSPKYG